MPLSKTGPSIQRATYEAALAAVHRRLIKAEEMAHNLRRENDAFDLHLMQMEVIRITNESLRTKPQRTRLEIKEQTSSSDFS